MYMFNILYNIYNIYYIKYVILYKTKYNLT